MGNERSDSRIGEERNNVKRCEIQRACPCKYSSIQLLLSFIAVVSVQHYSSSAPEPVAAFSYSAASPMADTASGKDQADAEFSRYLSKASAKVSFTSKGAV